jgi:hypothetical protein
VKVEVHRLQSHNLNVALQLHNKGNPADKKTELLNNLRKREFYHSSLLSFLELGAMSNSSDILFIQAHARKEIACYGLPYGGIGFSSHIITYYTMTMLYFGRKPLQPWKRVRHKKWSLGLSAASLSATIVLTSLAIHKCKQQWEFMILGVWMLTTSITISLLTMASPALSTLAVAAAAAKSKQNAQQHEGQSNPAYMVLGPPMAMAPMHPSTIQHSQNPSEMKYLHHSQMPIAQEEVVEDLVADSLELSAVEIKTQSVRLLKIKVFLGTLWFLGCVAGIVAVINISIPQFKYEVNHSNYFHLFAITIIFGVLSFLPIIILVSRCTDCPICCCCPHQLNNTLLWTPPFISMFALLWMDWSLGIITGNLAGVPSKNVKTLYWSYFAAKRLGLLAA